MRKGLHVTLPALLAAGLFLIALGASGEDQSQPAGKPSASRPPVPDIDAVTPKTRKAARKGDRWLFDVQKPSGAWSCEPDSPPSVSITSLAMLALVSRGASVDGTGPRSRALRKGLDWILDRPAHGSGFVSTYDATGLGPIYDHANAVLLLSQLHGQINYRAGDVRRTLEDAVSFLGRLQWESGGWGQQRAQLGITGAVYQALRSANSSGIRVNADLSKARAFTRDCRTEDGGFSLTPSGGDSRAYWATSSGLRILMGVGDMDEYVRESFKRLQTRKLGSAHDSEISEWDYASLMMLVQAMLHERGRFWANWFPMIRKQLLTRQNKDGSWEVEYCKQCRGFATSVAILFLRSPYLLLPIFQR